MKLKHLLLLLTRHRITVTLSGVLVITVISSLLFVQNVFGQNPLIQIYETIQPMAAASSSDTAAESMEPSSDIGSLSDTIQESTPVDTSLEVTAEPAAPITEALITEIPITEVPITAAPVTETLVTAKETTVAASAAAPTAQPHTIQEAVPAVTAAETAAAIPAPAAETCAGSYDSAMAGSVLDFVNKERSNTGLLSLVWNDSLASSARIRAQEIAACFDHIRPDGSAWWTAGDQLQMAENLGKEQISAEGVVSDWMASPSHAANILNGEYSNMGVACYYFDGTYYWTQEFY